MRVIAGIARGTRLEEPGDLPIRPTLDRVREAVFSMLLNRIEGARFLDLYAGTGANGIEALSRGAAAVTFVDSQARVSALIRRNLSKSGLHANARVLLLDLPADLPRACDPMGSYDIVYADPPHAWNDYEALLEGLRAPGLLAEDAWILLEHPEKVATPETAHAFTRTRQRRYGRTMISVYS